MVHHIRCIQAPPIRTKHYTRSRGGNDGKDDKEGRSVMYPCPDMNRGGGGCFVIIRYYSSMHIIEKLQFFCCHNYDQRRPLASPILMNIDHRGTGMLPGDIWRAQGALGGYDSSMVVDEMNGY